MRTTPPPPDPGAQGREQQCKALLGFLRADPEQWSRLAPRLMESLGRERLQAVVSATRGRVGGTFEDVTDSSQGLRVSGPAGHVLAWAVTDAQGSLTGVLLSGSGAGTEVPPAVRRWLSRLVWMVLLAGSASACWTASDVRTWLVDLCVALAVGIFFVGYQAPRVQPWWFRSLVTASLTAAVLSGIRAYDRAPGHGLLTPLTAVLVVMGLVGLLQLSRRWPLNGAGDVVVLARFPMQGRDWYVVQGGGWGLNHHLSVPEQTGAIDVVRVGLHGSFHGGASNPDSYLAYGAVVHAPCDGRVIAASDGAEDQIPGAIRLTPPYGNHIVIDTGRELVKLAHLRPGSVRVTRGDVVTAGQPLGQVGNSGNTTEPHLHVHAERAGTGLRIRFADVGGPLYRGRTVNT